MATSTTTGKKPLSEAERDRERNERARNPDDDSGESGNES